jgi:hypothetical protein
MVMQVVLSHKRRKEGTSTVWSFIYAEIFGRREIMKFSTMHMFRSCRLLQKSKKTSPKEQGLSRE